MHIRQCLSLYLSLSLHGNLDEHDRKTLRRNGGTRFSCVRVCVLLSSFACFQARLGGMAVKKRREGALKFPPPHATDQLKPGARTIVSSSAGVIAASPVATVAGETESAAPSPKGTAVPPSPEPSSAPLSAVPSRSAPRTGGRQTSLLDYYSIEVKRRPEQARVVDTVDDEPGEARENEPHAGVVAPSPVCDPVTVDMDTDVDMDMAEVGDAEHGTGDDQRVSTRRDLSPAPRRSPRDAEGEEARVTLDMDSIVPPSTPKKNPPSPDAIDLLGRGMVGLGGAAGSRGSASPSTSGGSSASPGGGDGHAVYSDRFIPSRFGSILESGSPFLVTSSPTASSSEGRLASHGVGGGRAGVRGRLELFGGSGDGGGRGVGTGGSGGAAARRDAADPGGIQGTEGASPGVHARGGVAMGAGGVTGGTVGTGSGGADGSGSPQYWPYGSSATDAQREGQNMLNMLLRSELLGADTVSPARRDGIAPSTAGGSACAMDAAGRRGSGGTAGAPAGSQAVTGVGMGTPPASGSSPNVFRYKVSRACVFASSLNAASLVACTGLILVGFGFSGVENGTQCSPCAFLLKEVFVIFGAVASGKYSEPITYTSLGGDSYYCPASC